MLHLFDEDKLTAATYYRFSAEDKQENSIENQREAVEKKVASEEDIQIIDSFQDEGISGLTFNRPGFQAMLEKYVYAENAPKLDYILFYDASRFGRVQDISHAWRLIADMGDRNIRLGSVDRGIPRSDMTVADTIIMTLDFVLSREQVRLLSAKVSAGSKKVASQGFSAGGTAPYGYVRILLDEQHKRVRVLEAGVHKEVSNQRVSFEPSTSGEAEVVRRIFDEFVRLNYFPHEIADRLNEDCIKTAKGRQWNSSGVIRILTNETYTGTRVYNKTWAKLKEEKRNNPPEEWVRCVGAHEALVDYEVFYAAQKRLFWLRPRTRNRHLLHVYKAQAYVLRYVENVLADFSEDQKYYIRKHLPTVFAIPHKANDKKQACFHIPNKHRKYDRVICVELDIDSEEISKVRQIYRIKTDSLANKTYVFLNSDTKVEPVMQQELNNLILELSNSVLGAYAPWLVGEDQPSDSSIAPLNAVSLKTT